MLATTLRTFHYRHTTYFVIEAADGRGLAVDAGWPGSFLDYARALKDAGGRFERIAWALATHFHPDHAGLVGEFQARGVECLAIDGQAKGIPAMEALIARSWPDYRAIATNRLQSLTSADSRAWLAARGIDGVVLPTPGHSDDSVSVVLDSGDAMVGDLTVPALVMPDDDVALDSWARLRAAGARRAHHAHAGSFDVPDAV